MTYRELVNACYESCGQYGQKCSSECTYVEECKAFEDKTGGLVIRCKDCRYFYKNDLDEWDCKYLGHINALTPSDFCSAARKKGE